MSSLRKSAFTVVVIVVVITVAVSASFWRMAIPGISGSGSPKSNTTTASNSFSTANQYWISTSGSDGNPGTQASPWATIAHANAALVLGTSGTVVHVASGTYNGCIVTTRTGTATQR
ncbi:MAG: Right handed beta helix region, partial [Acidobacteriaceae bacterium]|nr:Right handed beta helix region [Acidobacteriaceae bacterium]